MESNTFFQSIYFLNNQIGFVSGENSKILKTTDGGETWTTKYQPEISIGTIDDLQFPSTSHGYAKTYYQLLKTEDGGTTWSVKSSITEFIQGMFVKDVDTVYIVTSQKSLYISTDGGTTWTTKSIPLTGDYPNSVFFESDLIGWITTYKGKLYKTTDGGDSWILKYTSSETNDSNRGIEKVNASTYYVFGKTIARSIDGGETWVELTTPTYSSMSGYYVDESNLIIVPRFNEIYKYHGNILGGNGYQITQPALSNSNICAGEEITISFDATDSGNYYVELSDENGNFDTENPNIIGQINGTGSLNLTVNLPSNLSTSSNYKVQVYLTSPTTAYSDASNNITIQGTINPSIDNLPNHIQDIDDAITLVGSPSGGTFDVNGTNATTFAPSSLGIGIHTVDYTVNQNGCDATVTQYTTVSVGQSVAINTAISSICAGNNLTLALDMQGTFEVLDIYSVQLSDVSGSFNNPTDLATIVGQQSGALTVSIPSFIAEGNDYKIRVFGNNNSSNEVGPIHIQAAPNPTIHIEEPSYYLADGEIFTLTANYTEGGNNPSFSWYRNGNLYASNITNITVPNPTIGDVFYVSMTSNANCSDGDEVVSIPVFLEEVIWVETCNNAEAGDLSSLSFNDMCDGGFTWILPTGNTTGTDFNTMVLLVDGNDIIRYVIDLEMNDDGYTGFLNTTGDFTIRSFNYKTTGLVTSPLPSIGLSLGAIGTVEEGCFDITIDLSETTTLTVLEVPENDWTIPSTDFCEWDYPITCTAINDLTGNWTSIPNGSVIDNGDGTASFDPFAAGFGKHNIVYNLGTEECGSIKGRTVNIYPNFYPEFDGSIASNSNSLPSTICKSAAPITLAPDVLNFDIVPTLLSLEDVFPPASGGTFDDGNIEAELNAYLTWTGAGITDLEDGTGKATFDPSGLTPGTYTVTLSIAYASQCEETFSADIEVLAANSGGCFDPSDCQNNVTITYDANTNSLPSISQASDYIEAGNELGTAIVSIGNGQNISFKAGKGINLLPGFSVVSGGVFDAYIEDCPDEAIAEDNLEEVKNKTSVHSSDVTIDTDFIVFPNPFEEKLNVHYYLQEDSRVRLYITDMTGKEVNRVIEPQLQTKGTYRVAFTPCDCLSGVYFLILEVNGTKKVEKILKQ